MLRATDENGLLVYPEFIETTQQIIPLWKTRILGGLLYGVGILMLGVNLAMTWKSQPLVRSKTVQSGPAAGSIVEEETEDSTNFDDAQVKD